MIKEFFKLVLGVWLLILTAMLPMAIILVPFVYLGATYNYLWMFGLIFAIPMCLLYVRYYVTTNVAKSIVEMFFDED